MILLDLKQKGLYKENKDGSNKIYNIFHKYHNGDDLVLIILKQTHCGEQTNMT